MEGRPVNRRCLLLAAAATLLAMSTPAARADRLGGNYRGPDDTYRLHEETQASPEDAAARDPLLASFGLGRPFLAGVEAGRKEAAFRGRPLLVFWVLPGCNLCETVARGTFRDIEILDLASRCVATVADAEREAEFGIRNRVRTIPTILLLDAAGRETGRAEGVVDAARVAALLREAIRKFGPARPGSEARALERSAAEVAKSREAKDWRRVIAAADAVEKIGHEGPELELAREARREAAREATGRLDAARALIAQGERTDGRRLLERVARDFEGIEQSAVALSLLQDMNGARNATRRMGLGTSPSPATGTSPPAPGVEASGTTPTDDGVVTEEEG
jgi:hypothetical protein